MHNCVGVHCALRVPLHCVLIAVVPYRVTALTKLRFAGTVFLAPHGSASKAGSDLTAAPSSENCGASFRWAMRRCSVVGTEQLDV